MSAENLTTHFLPINARMRKAQPPPPAAPAKPPAKGPAAKPPPNAHKTAEQNRQRDRDLGTYGEQLMERIYKDYESQIEDWRIAFGDVVTAFARAIGGRDRTLKEAELEHQRDAALEALVFSLLLAGSMRFLGAYVQYTLVPRIKVHSAKVQWDSSMPGVGVVPVSAPMFSSMTASAFGGVSQDIGNRLVPLAFPAPSVPSQPLDSWDGVWNLQNEFNKLIGQSKQLVLNQFKDVQAWMTDSTEFGAEWALYTGGDVERARQHIYRHIDSLRQQWAKEWEFFGKKPITVHLGLLADQYERSLWAGYLLERLKNVEKAAAGGAFSRGGTGDMLAKKVLENAIIRKLKQLNVVKWETKAEHDEQLERLKQGSPLAPVVVEGRIDRLSEALRLRDWAGTYLKDVQAKTVREFFPPARERNLERL